MSYQWDKIEEVQSRNVKTNEVLEEGAQDHVVLSVNSSRQIQKNETHTMTLSTALTNNVIMDTNEGCLSAVAFPVSDQKGSIRPFITMWSSRRDATTLSITFEMKERFETGR